MTEETVAGSPETPETVPSIEDSIQKPSNYPEEFDIVSGRIFQQGFLHYALPWVGGFVVILWLAINTLLDIVLGETLHTIQVFGLDFQSWLTFGFAVACGAYFFQLGLYKVPVAHVGIPILLGKRNAKNLFEEGYCWYFPKPIGSIWAESIKKTPLDIEIVKVLTQDKMPVTISLSLTYQVSNVYQFLNVDNPIGLLENEAGDQIRSDVADMTHSDLVLNRKQFAEKLLTNLRTQMGVVEKKNPEGGVVHQPLMNGTGIFVSAIQVAGIRLPEELEEAATKVQVEEQERKSDMTNVETLSLQVKHLIELGLTPQEAMASAQATRRERQVITIDGNSGSQAKDGVAFGIGLNAANQSPSKEGTPTAVPFGPKTRRSEQQKK